MSKWVTYIFLLTVFAAPSVFAKITIVSITGVSNYTVDGTTSAIVYGGTAGTCSNGTSTCDSCTGTLTACNLNRITPTTVVTIQFKSDEQTGYPTIGDDTNGAQIKEITTSAITKGVTTSITYTWDEICTKIVPTAGHVDCETSGGNPLNAAVVLRVGIDSSSASDNKLDGTNDDYIRVSFRAQNSMAPVVDLSQAGSSEDATNGVTSWSVYPGDGKIYLEDVSTYQNFPFSANTTQYSQLHLFYRVGNCTDVALITNKTGGTTGNLKISTGIKADGQFDDNRFLGFENEITYVFKVALQDQAGNIGLFYPNSPCVNGTHSVTPSEVFGLLKDQKNCFIATAAYGSPLEHHVKTLRQFRDHVLLKFNLGKQFVRAYYKFSPPIAQTISESDFLRTASRVALSPLWAFAALSGEIGMLPATVIFLAMTGALAIIISWSLSRRRAR